MIDYPPVEHHYHLEARVNVNLSDISELHLLNRMLDALADADFADESDPVYCNIRDYLRECRDKVLENISCLPLPRYNDEILPFFNEEDELLSKGMHQNHDKEVRRQCQKEEFAVRDERYYNRYHMIDLDRDSDGR